MSIDDYSEQHSTIVISLEDCFYFFFVSLIKHFDILSGIPKKANTTKNSSPNATDILCCEVCGKNGLRQEFSASGRFCGLSCVGVYTGRRNKGREFVRKVKTADGKIVKKKKKGKGKKIGTVEKPPVAAGAHVCEKFQRYSVLSLCCIF